MGCCVTCLKDFIQHSVYNKDYRDLSMSVLKVSLIGEFTVVKVFSASCSLRCIIIELKDPGPVSLEVRNIFQSYIYVSGPMYNDLFSIDLYIFFI